MVLAPLPGVCTLQAQFGSAFLLLMVVIYRTRVVRCWLPMLAPIPPQPCGEEAKQLYCQLGALGPCLAFGSFLCTSWVRASISDLHAPWAQLSAPPSPGAHDNHADRYLRQPVHEVTKTGTLLDTYMSGRACLSLSVRFLLRAVLGSCTACFGLSHSDLLL